MLMKEQRKSERYCCMKNLKMLFQNRMGWSLSVMRVRLKRLEC